LGKPAFQAFAKPYFDKGRLGILQHWNVIFILIKQRNAWFDELLNTQMKICRGSSTGENRGGMEDQTVCFIDDGSE
jgi:hypothetical protein